MINYEYDEFTSCVNRASMMLALGFDFEAVVEYLSKSVPAERAHLYTRAGELHLKWCAGS